MWDQNKEKGDNCESCGDQMDESSRVFHTQLTLRG